MDALPRAGLALPLLAALLVAAPRPAGARPSDYIFSPIVEPGEWEVDSKAGLARGRDRHSFWSASLGVEYGVTRWWATEATLNFGREPGASTRIDSIEWENRFQLTPHDGRPYAVGALLEIERARDRAEGWELRYGPLLQWQPGRMQFNLNLLFERAVDADESEPTRFGYQWQWRHDRAAAFDVGLQGFGDLGRWDHWAPRREQSHLLGPAFFLQFGDDEDEPSFELGLLFGTGGAAPRQTLRLQGMFPF